MHTALEGPLEVWNDCSELYMGKEERPNHEES